MKWMAAMLVMGLFITTVAIAGEQSVTGTVEKTDQGIVIASDDGATYRVEGQDLSAMVGKTVRAIGTLSEKDGGKTLTIINIEPVEE